jgi:hypothetical protein
MSDSAIGGNAVGAARGLAVRAINDFDEGRRDSDVASARIRVEQWGQGQGAAGLERAVL